MRPSEKLKKIRSENDFTQEYLALELDVSQKTYSNMENGISKINLLQIKKIAEVYDVRVLELIKELFSIDDQLVVDEEKFEELSTNNNYFEKIEVPIDLLKNFEERIKEQKEIIRLQEEKIKELEAQLLVK